MEPSSSPHSTARRPAKAPTIFQHRGLISLATVATGLLFGAAVAEIGLRAIGFKFQTFPTVQFGWPDPSAIVEYHKPDRDLFWVPPDYEVRLEAARRLHPVVVFMGDSNVENGTYPRLTLDRLRVIDPTLANGIKVGVIGWTSEQGLTQLRRDILPLRPRVVVAEYGWNDHWVAFGPPDSENRPDAISWWLSQHSRVAQLLLKFRFGLRYSPRAARLNRVSIQRYMSNLRRMAGLARQAGARTVFITAPSGHVRGHEPAYLAERWVRRLSDVVPLHQSYVEATRQAARSSGAVLCDAAAIFETFEPPREQYFKQDGIHLSEIGDRRMADIVTGCIVNSR